MDQRLIDALNAHSGIHDWTVRRQQGRSTQIYLVGDALENLRQVEREAYEVEILNDHPFEGQTMRGSVTLPLSRADLDRLDSVLDDAVTMAGLVHNPPWELAERADYPDVDLADPLLSSPDAALAAGREAADRVRELASREKEHGVHLPALELFLDHVEEELGNSRGVSVSSTSTRVLAEATLLASDGPNEAEYFRQARARRLSDLQMDELVVRGSELARTKLRAVPPRTRTGPVVIAGEAVGQLMAGGVLSPEAAYLAQASASSAYTQISRFEIGEPVYLGRERTGDTLTLRSNARHPYAVMSYRADADGLPAADLLVIDDGVLVNRPASQRYAQYLQLPATGRAGTAEITPGRLSQSELEAADGPLYLVLAFSAANVDVLSGDFGMEIRLGYEISGGVRQAIAGGSVSGNLFEAMAAAHLSRETTLIEGYFGPTAIRFDALQVAGED
jgi:predicted Zn-dependent protease